MLCLGLGTKSVGEVSEKRVRVEIPVSDTTNVPTSLQNDLVVSHSLP